MKTSRKKIRRKLIGIISLSLGIHFMVAHFNKVFPFGFEFEKNALNNALMFIWAYTGSIQGVLLVTYGIERLFHETVDKILNKIERR